MSRGQLLWLATAVGWTLFVWVARIRNALEDPAVGGGVPAGVLALSASFILGALAVAAVAWLGRRSRPGITLVRAVWALTAWTTVVWASRIAAIAMRGDHDFAFVAVHAVIGVMSIMLWVITACSVIERHSEEIAPVS